MSQRKLAVRLGMHASRLVALMDEMQSMGLIERQSNTEDRRANSLQVTAKGREALAEIGKVARQHDEAVCRSLNQHQRETLQALLQMIADAHGLAPGVHPGYGRLREKRSRQE